MCERASIYRGMERLWGGQCVEVNGSRRGAWEFYLFFNRRIELDRRPAML
jgi:hypothetical protein